MRCEAGIWILHDIRSAKIFHQQAVVDLTLLYLSEFIPAENLLEFGHQEDGAMMAPIRI